MKTHIVTAAVALFAAFGAMALAQPEASALPYCQLEDGSDVDGQCIWIDPDTGNAYINPTPEETNR